MKVWKCRASSRMHLLLLFLCFRGVFVDVFGLEPSFDVPVINVTVLEGNVAILPCSIDNLGEHQVVWTDQRSTLLTLEDKRITKDPRISIERPYTKDWNLHIRETAYTDQGQYICQINTSPVKAKTVMLIVQVPAKIINELSSRDQTVREGETVTLVCNVTGVPIPDVTWYKLTNEGNKDKERINNTGEVLLIHNVSRYSDGTYECVASNNVDPADSRQIKVLVEFAPEIYFPVRRTGQYPGRDIRLDCVVMAYPQAVMYWKKGERIVVPFYEERYQLEVYEDNEESTTLSLWVRDIQPDDFGSYTCYAENAIGHDRESLVLYELGHESTTSRTTSKAAHDHVTFTAVLHALSLITSTLVLL